jgi:hypothetical protein
LNRSIRFLGLPAAVLVLAACSSTPAAQPNPTAAAPVTSAAPITVAPSSAPASAPPPSSAAATRPPDTSGPNEPTAATSFTGVQLTREGGIAGITETITVRPNGSWTVRTSRGAERSGKLVPTQQSRLQSLVNDPKLAAEATRKPVPAGHCSDAYTYLLVAGDQHVRYTSCGQADKPATTMAIISLVQSATKGQ